MAYADELLKHNYVGNVVVQLFGEYFAIRVPDSGLSVPAQNRGILTGLTLNPTQIDLKRVNTTIANYTFTLLDKDNVITQLLSNNDSPVSVPVSIWVGRSPALLGETALAFADYFQLPATRIKSITHSNNTYVITTAEFTDKMTVPKFNNKASITLAMLAISTQVEIDVNINNFPNTGLIKIENEFMTYNGRDLTNNILLNLTRGTEGSIAVAHAAGVTVDLVVKVQDNPITILLQMLISPGGGGTYDVLPDGLGISQTDLDVAGLENLRDTKFTSQQFLLYLYNIDSVLAYLEQEILFTDNLRFALSTNSKLTLVLLDQVIFGQTEATFDEDTIHSYPKWSINQQDISNQIIIDWDYDELSGNFQQHSVFTDAISVTNFGPTQPIKIESKGIKASLSGAAIVADRATRLLERFSTPTPRITVETLIDKSLSNVGDKVLVISSRIPTSYGTLEFSEELEILSRAIDPLKGTCSFLLAFTNYTGFRSCFIGPSDVILTFTAQDTFKISMAHANDWNVGWKVLLWDTTTLDYTTDPLNTITEVHSDGTIKVAVPWATTLVNNRYRLKFPLYDDATPDQRRYGFIGINPGETFADGSSSYLITF